MFDRDVSSPSILLTSSFFISTICACFYSEEWEFSDLTLVGIVVLGLSSFILFSFFIKFFDSRTKITTPKELVEINLTKGKLCIYLIFQIILIIATLNVIKQNVGAFELFSGKYYELKRSDNIIYKSRFVDVGWILNFSGTYYLIYIACNNLLLKSKKNILLYINIFLGCIGSLLMGTKTAFFMFLIGFFISYLLLFQKKVAWTYKPDFKTVCKMFLTILVFLFSFTIIDYMQGRTLDDVTPIDKLATYLGAPLKNLELFINENHSTNQLVGEQTFKNFYSSIFKDLPVASENLYKYRWINAHPLGNVSSMFMPIFYDFGVPGIIIIFGLFGIFCQKIYDKIKYEKTVFDTDFFSIFYSFLSFSIIFSFFSNKFFESAFSKAGVYFVIGLFLFDYFFLSLKGTKFTKRKTRLKKIRKSLRKLS